MKSIAAQGTNICKGLEKAKMVRYKPQKVSVFVSILCRTRLNIPIYFQDYDIKRVSAEPKTFSFG